MLCLVKITVDRATHHCQTMIKNWAADWCTERAIASLAHQAKIWRNNDSLNAGNIMQDNEYKYKKIWLQAKEKSFKIIKLKPICLRWQNKVGIEWLPRSL